jgi:CAAX protease family protein
LETEVASPPVEARSFQYVAPFATFLLLLAIGSKVPLDTPWGSPLRVTVLAVVCVTCWPKNLTLRPSQPLASIGIGALVFLLWIAPDRLFPGYRNSPLFSNSIIGHLHSSLSPDVLHDAWTLGWRCVRAIVIVPIVEELFWRAWFMRWLINISFTRVPLGTYTAFSFWTTALLFASEHGPYWDVGLLTGIVYNFWMIRTKSVGDCVLMHAVTNALLSGYVLTTGQWQYWQ